jgi:hypothetical protein
LNEKSLVYSSQTAALYSLLQRDAAIKITIHEEQKTTSPIRIGLINRMVEQKTAHPGEKGIAKQIGIINC